MQPNFINEPLVSGLHAPEHNTEPAVHNMLPANNIFANATALRRGFVDDERPIRPMPNIIQNLQDVDHDLHSQQDFGEKQVF